jgi:hypothetical protein
MISSGTQFIPMHHRNPEQTTVSLVIQATHKKTLLLDLLFLQSADALGERMHNEKCQQEAPLLYHVTLR